MQKIKLDFHQNRHVSAWRWVGIGLFIFAITLNVLLVIKSKQNADKTNALLAEIDRINRPVQLATKSDDDPREDVTNQVKEAGDVIKRLNLPWPGLLKALEDTREKDIDLLSVTPDIQTGDVLIIGQTNSLPAAFGYITRLKKSQVFSKIELISHEKVMQNGVQALRFTITAKWSAAYE